jgi:hypothetical protein
MKKADNFDASKWLVENKVTFQSRLSEWSNDDDSDWMDQEEDDPNDYDEEGNMKDDAYRREFGYSFQEKQNYEKILDQVKEKYNFDPFDTNSLKNYDKIEAEAKEMYAQKYGSSFGESKLNEAKEILIEDHKDEALEAVNKFIDEFESQGLFEFIPDLNNYEIDSSTNSLNIDELGSVYLISNEGPVPNEVKELMMDSNNGEINKNGATWKKYPKNGYYYIVVS